MRLAAQPLREFSHTYGVKIRTEFCAGIVTTAKRKDLARFCTSLKFR